MGQRGHDALGAALGGRQRDQGVQARLGPRNERARTVQQLLHIPSPPDPRSAHTPTAQRPTDPHTSGPVVHVGKRRRAAAASAGHVIFTSHCVQLRMHVTGWWQRRCGRRRWVIAVARRRAARC
jgi:hypothetical protein